MSLDLLQNVCRLQADLKHPVFLPQPSALLGLQAYATHMTNSTLFLKKKIYIDFLVYLRVHTHTLLQAWTSEDTLWNSVLACTTGVPGIKLRWSSLAATTFTHRAMPPAAPTTTRFSRQCLREPRLLSYSQVAHGDLKLRIFRLHLPRAGVLQECATTSWFVESQGWRPQLYAC